jgi:hypothetical protein
LTKVIWYFTLRQAQGEDRLHPHAELVEALPRNFCQGTYLKPFLAKDIFGKNPHQTPITIDFYQKIL